MTATDAHDDERDAPSSADFVAEDEFDTAEDFFPFAPVQQWAVLCESITPEQLAVLTFTMAHLNPLTGRFDAKFGRSRVAERFGRSLDWVDKQFKGLLTAGAMSRQHMYWLDAKNRRADAPRSPEPVDPETGMKRAQAANRWRVRMSPPGASSYLGPINIAEFYRPDRIAKRTAGETGAASERPPIEQGKQGTPPQKRGAATQRPGGAVAQRPRGAATQRPKLSREGTTKGRNSVRPSGDARARDHVPDSESSRTPDGRTDNTPEYNTPHAGPALKLLDELEVRSALQDYLGGRPSDHSRQPAESSTCDQGADSSGCATTPNRDNPQVSREDVARDLLGESEVRSALAKLDCRASQRTQLVKLVNGMLTEHTVDQVRGFLLRKASESTKRRISYVLNACRDYAADIAEIAPLEHEKTRQARAMEARTARVQVWEGRWDGRPQRQEPAASPVSWLDDAQYAQLGPADQATVRAIGDRAVEELDKLQRERVTRIRRRFQVEAA